MSPSPQVNRLPHGSDRRPHELGADRRPLRSGGLVVVNDVDRRTTFAYVMNRMQPGLVRSESSAAYLKAFFAAL